MSSHQMSLWSGVSPEWAWNLQNLQMSLWTGVSPVWSAKWSSLQTSLRTKVSYVLVGKLSSFQMSLWTGVSPEGTGNSRVSRCPCELDWALCELRSRAISRCACGHEWTLSGRKGWVVSRCPFSRLCGRRDCVGYNIGWKTSMWTDWPAHFPGMKQKIKERKINTN